MTDQKNIEALVQKLGDYVESNYQTLVNPKQTVPGSTVRILFRAVSSGTPLLHKVAKAYGIPVGGWHETLDKIVEQSEANGSHAADKIKEILPKTKALDAAFQSNEVRGVFAKIRFAKTYKPQ